MKKKVSIPVKNLVPNGDYSNHPLKADTCVKNLEHSFEANNSSLITQKNDIGAKSMQLQEVKKTVTTGNETLTPANQKCEHNDIEITSSASKPEKIQHLENSFLRRFVWAKLSGLKHWPAITINPSDCGRQSVKHGHIWVFWFGDHKISEIPMTKTTSFINSFTEMFKRSRSKLRLKAILEALQILAKMSHINIDNEKLIAWARDGFPDLKLKEDESIRMLVRKYLVPIRNALKKGTSEESSEPEICLPDLLRDENVNIEEICVSCHRRNNVVSGHPFFIGGLCRACVFNLKEHVFTIGDDGKNICCIICALPGFLILCENEKCPKSYCKRCLTFIMGIQKVEQVMNTSPWICIFCLPNDLNNCILKIRENWEQKLLELFDGYKPNMVFSDFVVKRPLNVLSLFDGISTGKLVLNMLGISVNKYYSCEIDDSAVKVSKENHPGSITYLGDATDILVNELQSLEKIDLILGGSPCNDFSLANPRRRDIYESCSSGKLAIDFFSILNAVRKTNKNVFYLFENVSSMKKKNKDLLTDYSQDDPVMIDSVFFSPQTRVRYYWSNIPGLHGLAHLWNSTPTEAFESHKLDEYLVKAHKRLAVVNKIRTVTSHNNSLIQSNNMKPVIMNGKPDTLYITELEIIFGLPKNYTGSANLSISQRQQLLGKAWSVQVIKTILQPLKNFFKCK